MRNSRANWRGWTWNRNNCSASAARRPARARWTFAGSSRPSSTPPRCGPKRRSLQRQRQALAAEIDRRRQALLEADRDVRTLEKLRENQLQAHRQEEERQEGKRLDEAALQATGQDDSLRRNDDSHGRLNTR